MYIGKTLFAQRMDFLSWTTFTRMVTRYGGDVRVRTLPCTEHLRVLAFAHLTYRESLRDIEACLSAQVAKLYHMGIRSPVRRATLADANERRDWRIDAEFAQRLITQACKLYATEDLGFELSNTVYALDATTIDPCLARFPWAPFRSTKAAVKRHTLLDLRGNIPSVISISDGKLARCQPPRSADPGSRCLLRDVMWSTPLCGYFSRNPKWIRPISVAKNGDSPPSRTRSRLRAAGRPSGVVT